MDFKNKKFKKSVAILAFSTSLYPVLFQNIQETKVFAGSISEKLLKKLACLLSFTFKKFKNSEKIVMDIIEYIKKKYNEVEEDEKNKNEKKIKAKDNKEAKDKKDDNVASSNEEKVSSKNERSTNKIEESSIKSSEKRKEDLKKLEKHKDVCFNEQDLKNIEKEPECNDSLIPVILGLKGVDAVNYDRDIESFKYPLRSFEGLFSQINTDAVEFLSDEKGNQVLVYKMFDKKTGKLFSEEVLSFCVNSRGSVFLKFPYRLEYETIRNDIIPARMFFGGALESSRRINVPYLAGWLFLDTKKVINTFLEPNDCSSNADTYINGLENLLKVFEKKDKNGPLAVQARKALSLFKTARLCAEKSDARESYKKESERIDVGDYLGEGSYRSALYVAEKHYKENMLAAFAKAKPPQGCSDQVKENYKYLNEVAIDYARYVGIKVKDNSKDVFNKEVSASFESGDFTYA